MMSFNQAILLGSLGCDPTLIAASEKGAFVRLSIATSKRYQDAKGEWQQSTQWHTVFANNGCGKAAQKHLKKGSKVCVIGELRRRSWKDKEGKQQFETAVYAKVIHFLDPSSKLSDIPDDHSEDILDNIPDNLDDILEDNLGKIPSDILAQMAADVSE